MNIYICFEFKDMHGKDTHQIWERFPLDRSENDKVGGTLKVSKIVYLFIK